MIAFRCPKCNQSFEAPESMIGQKKECPACSTKVEVPKWTTDKEAVQRLIAEKKKKKKWWQIWK